MILELKIKYYNYSQLFKFVIIEYSFGVLKLKFST